MTINVCGANNQISLRFLSQEMYEAHKMNRVKLIFRRFFFLSKSGEAQAEHIKKWW